MRRIFGILLCLILVSGCKKSAPECTKDLDCPQPAVCEQGQCVSTKCDKASDCPARVCQDITACRNHVCDYSNASEYTPCDTGHCDNDGNCKTDQCGNASECGADATCHTWSCPHYQCISTPRNEGSTCTIPHTTPPEKSKCHSGVCGGNKKMTSYYDGPLNSSAYAPAHMSDKFNYPGALNNHSDCSLVWYDGGGINLLT